MTSVCAAFNSAREFAWTMIWLRPPYPASVSCTAVSGAMTTSSWLEVPLDPFDAVTPITSKFVPLTWIVCPTGSCPPNSSLTTVGPMTATRLWPAF